MGARLGALVVPWTLLREAEDLDPRKATNRSRGGVEPPAWKTTVMWPPAKDTAATQGSWKGQGGPPWTPQGSSALQGTWG